MNFLRNKEIRISIGIDVILTIGAVGIAYLWNRAFALYMLAVCLLFQAVHYISTYKRYKKISELSAELDHLLHDDVPIAWEEYEEGELAILGSEVQKMTLRLREQQQCLMDEKKNLADALADISHQIRTPLTSINLLLTFVSDESATKATKEQKIREIYELLSRIEWLITTLLKLSRIDAGMISLQKESMPMQKLIELSAAPLLIPMELKGIQWQAETQGCFIGDPEWTGEAIGNIIKNCMENTPTGGYVRVRTQENVIYREIIIEDSGRGIAEEDLPHIFERFYKGKNSTGKSFGVGLALARGIIAGQNGTIKAENKKDGGARFVIRFY